MTSVLNFRNVQALPRVDYQDVFRVPLPPGAPADAEAWTRAIFDRRSPRITALLAAIGLLTGARRPSVGKRRWGFETVHRSADAVCLETLAWVGLVQVAVTVEPSAEIAMTTNVSYSGRAGRAFFELLIGHGHRRVVPFLLSRAAARWTS